MITTRGFATIWVRLKTQKGLKKSHENWPPFHMGLGNIEGWQQDCWTNPSGAWVSGPLDACRRVQCGVPVPPVQENGQSGADPIGKTVIFDQISPVLSWGIPEKLKASTCHITALVSRNVPIFIWSGPNCLLLTVAILSTNLEIFVKFLIGCMSWSSTLFSCTARQCSGRTTSTPVKTHKIRLRRPTTSNPSTRESVPVSPGPERCLRSRKSSRTYYGTPVKPEQKRSHPQYGHFGGLPHNFL